MSQSIRQSNLFAAEDWRQIYRAFLNVNFTSYDYDTIRQSLVEYVRINYPEDFNDFVDSSEFIAIIDMLAWLGQSLAFRVDLNARENFLDTAERRESIIRLANLLSYKPKRNQCSKGFLKIVGVKTNEDVIDSNGSNLNGIRVNWNDANNPDWNEQFVLILNSAFSKNSQFGQPIQKGVDSNNTRVQTYEIDTATLSNPGVFSFNANVEGANLPFENVNVSFNQESGYSERYPNPFANWNILYKNDGLGNQSKNTGFFTYFKQGKLQFQDYNVQVPVENRTINIDVDNINEDDVWVENIQADGTVDRLWTKVPTTYNTNIIYNNLPRTERDIYSVETRENDRISIRFADGRFGNVAFGLTRIYYRVSSGIRYSIRPKNIQNISIVVPYITKNNLRKNLTLFLSLQETITNSVLAESDSEIKTNAAQVYYTQNRMVSGEDYNVFPLSDPSILKCKAINRTYSGHNRYVDINDPTGSYQNTNVIGNDGIVYLEEDNNRIELENNLNILPELLVVSTVQNMMMEDEFKHFMYNAVSINARNHSEYLNLFDILRVTSDGTMGIYWNKVSGFNYSSTGRLVTAFSNDELEKGRATSVGISNPANTVLDLIKTGSLIKFKSSGWVSVSSIIDNGAGVNDGITNGLGNIRLSSDVQNGDILEEVLPPIRTSLNSTEVESIRLKAQTNATFGIYYNIENQIWEVLELSEEDNLSELTFSFSDIARKWMILFEKIGDSWTITARGVRYIFESEEDVRFFFTNEYKVVSKETGLSEQDSIMIHSNTKSTALINSIDKGTYNPKESYKTGDSVEYEGYRYLFKSDFSPTDETIEELKNLGLIEKIAESFGRDIELKIVDNFRYNDGYIEPRKVQISFTDNNYNGIADDPTIFNYLIFGAGRGNNEVNINNILFWEKYISYDNYEYYRPITIRNSLIFKGDTLNDAISLLSTSSYELNDGDVFVCIGNIADDISDIAFCRFDKDDLGEDGNTKSPRIQLLEQNSSDAFNNNFLSRIGRKRIYFMWNHFAPYDQRIDPSISNIIDIYTLTSEYDLLMRQYLNSTDSTVLIPEPPSSTQLSIQYSELNELKMISDQIIWHNVKYKLLFGSKAFEELRAKFKVIKLPTATMSDGEIKAEVINLINDFFEIENWDFGDTFYFSELAAYIHKGLALQISSIVLVPVNNESSFGSLYEVKPEPDEIFISAATVKDIDIIDANTPTNLRIRN